MSAFSVQQRVKVRAFRALRSEFSRYDRPILREKYRSLYKNSSRPVRCDLRHVPHARPVRESIAENKSLTCAAHSDRSLRRILHNDLGSDLGLRADKV